MTRHQLTGSRLPRRPGSASGFHYLVHDEFTNAVAAGSVNGTAAVPGPGTRGVTDTESNISITGGLLVYAGGKSSPSSAGDPEFYYGSLARAAGRAFITRWRTSSDQAHSYPGGWFSATGGNAGRSGLWYMNSNLCCLVISTVITIFNATTDTWYPLAVVARASGYHFLYQSGSDWILAWVDDSETPDPIYPYTYTYDEPQDYSHIRVADLGAPWSTAYGIATDHLAGSRQAEDTFSHEADCLIELTVDTLPGAATPIRFRFRKQDSNNYWYFWANDFGEIKIYETVSGNPTQRAGAQAGSITAGDRVLIHCNDTSITVYIENSLELSYASASNFKTCTAGELYTLGTAVVSNIVAWPRVLSGSALSALERYTA